MRLSFWRGLFAGVAVMNMFALPSAWRGELDAWSQVGGVVVAVYFFGRAAWRER